MGKQRKRTPKRTKAADGSPADDTADAWTKKQADSVRRASEADAARFGGDSPDLPAVFGYWVGYPLLLEWIGFGRDWSARPETISAYYALNHAHTQATRVLMREASRRGMDPHALHECGRVIQEVYKADPDLCRRRTSSIADTWPEGMGAARYALPAGQQEALRAGEAVVIRLAVAMDVARAAPALTPDDRAILEALSEAGTTLPQADIAAAAERDIKTVRERLKRLEAAGLVSRPCGVRSGFATTPAGLGLLGATRD